METVPYQKVEYKVKSIAKNIERIQGEDRYETSVKVAEKLGENDEIMLASGGRVCRCSIGSASCSNKRNSHNFNKAKELPQSSKEYIKSPGVTTTYVIGGTASIADSLKNQFRIKRVYGKDRFETNAEVIKAFP